MPVTADQVRALIDTARDPVPFIADAQMLVNEQLAGQGLSAERLDLIVKYLSAHFLVLAEEKGGLIRSKLGDSDESYKAEESTGLRSTRFGQQVLVFDTSGTMARIDKLQHGAAQFRVV